MEYNKDQLPKDEGHTSKTSLQHLRTKCGRDTFLGIADSKKTPMEVLAISRAPKKLQKRATEKERIGGSQHWHGTGKTDTPLNSKQKVFRVLENERLQDLGKAHEHHQEEDMELSEDIEADFEVVVVLEEPKSTSHQSANHHALLNPMDQQVQCSDFSGTRTIKGVPASNARQEHQNSKTSPPSCGEVEYLPDFKINYPARTHAFTGKKQKQDQEINGKNAESDSEVVGETKGGFKVLEDPLEGALPSPPELPATGQDSLKEDEQANVLLQPHKGKGGLKKNLLLHSCHLCRKAFSRKHLLIQHIDAVHQKPNVCEICGKSFANKAYLKMHIDGVHQKLKPYECEICDKAFSQKGSLKTHFDTIHRKLKLHKCEICGKTFSQKATLNVHIDTVHQKLKLFECEICGKAFSQKWYVEVHINTIHQKRKPHPCKICGKTFSQKWYVSNHIDTVHFKIKPHKCETCGMVLSTRQALRRHIDTVHLKL